MMNSIKIKNKVYQEFTSLRETCANSSEDDHWHGLWTTMENATTVHSGHRSPWIVELNDPQTKMFIHALQGQIEYLLYVQLDQALKDHDRKAANEIHYIARQMKQLLTSLEAK